MLCPFSLNGQKELYVKKNFSSNKKIDIYGLL